MTKTIINLSYLPDLYKVLNNEINIYRRKNHIPFPDGLGENCIVLEELRYVKNLILKGTKDKLSFFYDGKRYNLLEYLTNLKYLSVTGCPYMAGIDLQTLPCKSSLECLEISDSISYIDLSNFSNLTSLRIANCESLSIINGLEKLDKLDTIEIYGSPHLDEETISLLVGKMMKKKNVSILIDTLYYPVIIRLMREKRIEFDDSIYDISWIEKIGGGNFKTITHTTEQMAELYADLRELSLELKLNEINDPIQKIYVMYCWLCQNITYDHEALKNSMRMHSSKNFYGNLNLLAGPKSGINGMRNALYYRTAVCQGYTKLFQMWLKINNITSYDVDASCDIEGIGKQILPEDLHDSSKINHSIIRIDFGKNVYYCDTTNDSGFTRKYKAQSQRLFMKTIEELDQFSYPINDSFKFKSSPINQETRQKLSGIQLAQKTTTDNTIKLQAQRIIIDYDLDLYSDDLYEAQKELLDKKKILQKLLVLGYISNKIYKTIMIMLGEQFADIKKMSSYQKN